MGTHTFATKLLSLLFMLLLVSSAWAQPPTENNVVDHIKVGLDFGFGLPYVWANKDATRKNPRGEINASPNISLGLVLGYSFPLPSNRKIGPEIGINYGFTRRIKARPARQQSYMTTSYMSLELEEKYIQLPIAIKLCTFDDEDSYLASGLSIGYEATFLVSQQYTKEGLKVTDTVSSPAGALFLGGTLDFGSFYLIGKFKFPLDYFKNETANGEQALIAARILNTSLVEFNT